MRMNFVGIPQALPPRSHLCLFFLASLAPWRENLFCSWLNDFHNVALFGKAVFLLNLRAILKRYSTI
jgi:hypothetical protein